MKNKIIYFLQGLILLLTSLVITGYQLYRANQVLILPLVQSTANPTLYPNDPFVSTLVHYAAPVWRLIGELSNYIPYEYSLAILFLATRALVLFAAAYLAMTISRNSWLAAIGAMAFFALWPSPLIGHGTLVQNYFDHTSASIAFFLLAIAAFYAMRPYFWAVWLGLAFSLNSMYGVYAGAYFAVVFVIIARYRSDWKNWIKPLGLLLLLISPTILITASAFSIGATDNELWLRASEVRFPYHLYPLTWQPIQFASLFTFMLFYGLVMYRYRNERQRLFTHNMIWLGVSLLWLVLAFAAAYIIKSPALLVLHPARATDLWFAFAAISTIAVFAYLIENDFPRKRPLIIIYFVSILWYFLFDFTILTIFLLIVITLCVLIDPIWKWVMKSGAQIRISNIVVIVVILFGIVSLSGRSIINELTDPVNLPDQQVREIANWANENTSTEDLFLIDPNWSEFRSLSQRPIFVTWKDGSAILWERSYVEEWVDRIDSLGYSIYETRELEKTPGDIAVISRRYNRLRDEDVIRLEKNYSVRYWVVRANIQSSFPEVFRAIDYKVLLIEPPSE